MAEQWPDLLVNSIAISHCTVEEEEALCCIASFGFFQFQK